MDVGRNGQGSIWSNPRPRTLETAVLWTVGLGDVLISSLSVAEMHCFRAGTTKSLREPRELIGNGASAPGVGTIEDTELCPSYLLTEHPFNAFKSNLCTAHQIVHMVPIAGKVAYGEPCRRNPWVERFLPNGYGRARSPEGNRPSLGARSQSGWIECRLRWRPADRLEAWEMKRKIARFCAQNRGDRSGVFSPHCCKGRVDTHANWVHEAVMERISALGVAATTGETA